VDLYIYWLFKTSWRIQKDFTVKLQQNTKLKSNYDFFAHNTKKKEHVENINIITDCGDADKSLARPERKQTTATEDFDVHISHL
jgi:hypothetical protein